MGHGLEIKIRKFKNLFIYLFILNAKRKHLQRFTIVRFALTVNMVQNPPYWMAKECIRFEHKGIPTCQT